MDYKTVPGKFNKHEVVIYTISTCMWCTKLKRKLQQNNIEYTYLDVDLCDEIDELRSKLRRHRPVLAFPMMFIDDEFISNEFIDEKISDLVDDG